MRKKWNKTAAFVMAWTLILSSLGFFSAKETVSAYSYDAGKALAYAQAHWNDGQGQCAEFVSRCVQAGGIGIATKTTTYECYKAVLAATGLSGQDVTLNGSGYATYAANSGKLAAGDVVIQWCYTHDLRPHILLCGGYDSSGIATFYAHNGALNNARYQLNLNTAYQHTASCNMGAKVIHLSSAAAPSTTTDPISPTDIVPSSNAVYPYGNIAKGHCFGLSGMVYSKYPLQSVTAKVVNAWGAISLQKTVYPNTTSCALSGAIDNAITFNTLAEGWYSYHVIGTDSRGYSKEVITSTFSVGSPNQNPIAYLDAISGGHKSISLKGWAYDPSDNSQSLVIHAYVGAPAGNSSAQVFEVPATQLRPDVNETCGIRGNHGFESTIWTSKTGTQDVYLYAINIGSGDNTFLGSWKVTIDYDKEAPKISNVKISNVTANGYTVSCTATDNESVAKVQFPTWTESNGQDDLIWHNAVKSGSTYSYTVKTSEHKNETGKYITHIYAWDTTGNQSHVSAGEVTVEAEKAESPAASDSAGTSTNTKPGAAPTETGASNTEQEQTASSEETKEDVQPDTATSEVSGEATNIQADTNVNAASTTTGQNTKTEGENGEIHTDQIPGNENISSDSNAEEEESDEEESDDPDSDDESDNDVWDDELPQKGTILTYRKVKYKVTEPGETVQLVTVTNQKLVKLTIPDTITVDDITYDVVSVGKEALKNCKKLQSVTIGKNVTDIGSNAFRDCKKLKTIKVKTAVLKTVGKNALKGINAKATIKVPRKKLKSYGKLFKGKGQKKTVRIKASK